MCFIDCCHACRVVCITFVVEFGASVKEDQALARHATPDLTSNVHAKARTEWLQELTEKAGLTVLRGAKHAHSMHRKAVGAEGLEGNDWGVNVLHERDSGDGDVARDTDRGFNWVGLSGSAEETSLREERKSERTYPGWRGFRR